MSDENIQVILDELREYGSPERREHMAKFGINVEKALGVSIPTLRKLAKTIGRDHKTALKLWETGIHDARLLASMVDEVDKVTKSQMDSWAKDFNSWDLCDQCCNNLFVFTVYSDIKANSWSKSNVEFVKRAGFVLMAVQAVHHRTENNNKFIAYFNLIKRNADDNRNFVKKAVNWALRQIGKRNWELNDLALQVCEELKRRDSKTANWIAADAIRDLTSETAERRIRASLKKK